MNKPLKLIVASGFVVGMGYAAYHYLLTPEARENFKATVSKAIDLGKSMTEKMGESEESRKESVRLEANQAWISQQWEKMGY